MLRDDQERDGLSAVSKSSHSTSSDSSESVDSDPDPERASLLHGESSSNGPPSYKATQTAEPEVLLQDDAKALSTKSIASIISLLLVGVFVSNADGTLVLATYGTVSSEFGAFGDASWLTTSYALATCAVQPITGRLSDIYGRKRVLLVSYVLFAIGSVICGIAQSMWQVIAGRVVAGVGAAGMTVIVSVLITGLVPLIQVAAWRSYVNVAATLGRSIGGPLGGFLTDTIGWRWSFAGQAPLILLAILLVAFRLPSETKPQRKGQPSKLHCIDFLGAFLLAGTIVLLLGALSLGGQSLPWSHPLVSLFLGGSLVLGAAFAYWEIKYAFEPIFPPSLVIKRDVATPYAVYALQVTAQLSMMYTVPLYFRVTQNSTIMEAGSHLFPAVLGNTVGGLLAGFTVQKTGRYKFLAIFATISSSLTYFLLIVRWHGHTSVLESLEIIPGGFGTGMAGSATFIALTASLEHKDMAMATGGMYLSSSLGMVVGIAISSAIQMGTLKVFLENGLRGVDGAKHIIEQVISNAECIKGLEEGIRKLVIEGYIKSLEYSHMSSLACSLLALVMSFTIREHSLN